MVTDPSNNWHTLAPGIFSQGALCTQVQETANTLNIVIEPAANDQVTLYVIMQGEINDKKITVVVNFHHAYATLSIVGLYALHQTQSVDIQTTLNHLVPHCTSRQLWKGVLHDSAHASFEGRIYVAPHAQKTDAQLSNKNLLLSSTAEINTKPILEIYADDVKCTHGATVGCLDEDALFYLRARGISALDAKEILVQAFVDDILDRVPHE
jgi:Fe-S cluster assembly protein SufD